ncbi:MAG TPA: cation:proton antiporter [Lacipirellulaceae bacterium]|nr:cation:proton antiporter [Lacipirellulaceae bacterium]
MAARTKSANWSVWQIVVGYLVVAAVFIGLILAVLTYGDQLTGTAGVAEATTKTVATHALSPLYHVLLALVSILLLGRWMGKLFVYVGQPRVIGEMVAGIMLGPSLLGQVWPAAQHFVLPTDVAPYLGIISQIGVILYMFMVGLEMNAGLIKSKAHSTIAISHTSILVPFLLGTILALWLFPLYALPGQKFVSFALFMGISMSITAFPVLARILTDRKIENTALGVVALSCAAIDDVTAWCLLAFVVGVAQAEMSMAVQTLVYAMIYIAIMLLVVRPIAVKAVSNASDVPQKRMAVWVLVGLLVSAMTAEWIGIHSIFGAFLLGAIIPHDSEVARDFRHKLEDIVQILLLPAFFAYSGMRTEIGLVSGPQAWMFTAIIILIATLGKFGGTFVAAKVTGQSWRVSAALGVLMNTRGLMELIALNIGLDLGVISQTMFAMMVLMALITTMATTPILHLLSTPEVLAT